jgi:hypothetical protein
MNNCVNKPDLEEEMDEIDRVEIQNPDQPIV